MPRLLATTALVLALALAAWLLWSGDTPRRVVGPYGVSPPVAPPEQDREPEPTRVVLALPQVVTGPADAPPRPYGVAVRVVDEDGAAIPGVSIFRRAEPGLPAHAVPEPQGFVLAGVTDARGRAYVAEVSEVSVDLVFRAADWCALTCTVRTQPAGLDMPPHEVVLLRPSGMLQFEVVDETDQPVAGARIAVHPLEEASLRLLDLVTDAQGRVSFPWPPGMDLGVDIVCQGHVALDTWISTRNLEGDTSLRVVLPRGRRVAGRLVDAPGEALTVPVGLALGVHGRMWGRGDPSRRVEASSLASSVWRPWIQRSTGPGGTFEGWYLPEDPPPPLTLWAWRTDVPGRMTFELDASQPTEDLLLTWTLEPPARHEIRRRLLDADERPVEGALVTAWHALENGGWQQARALSGHDGTCRWSVPPEWGAPAMVVVQEASGIRQDLQPPEGDIVLRPLGAVAGRVQEADGRVPAEAWVTLAWRGDWPARRLAAPVLSLTRMPRTVRCDVRGEFQVLGLEPGPWRILAHASEVETRQQGVGGVTIRVARDGLTRLAEALVLPVSHVLSGRVRDSSGRAVPEALLRLLFTAGGGALGQADGAGHFRLRHVGVGSARLVVEAGGLSAERTVDLPADGDLGPLDVRLAQPPLLVLRFTLRTPADGLPVEVEYSPLGAPLSHRTRGTVFDGVLRTRLPLGMDPDVPYEAWAKCGRMVGDLTPLPTDLAAREVVEVDMVMRLPEDDLPLDTD